MSPLPYLPGGVTELPATRFVLFADANHRVQKIDESALTLSGTSFTGIWESSSLNGQEIEEKTLTYLTLAYLSAVTTTMTVKVSGDGGETWPESQSVPIVASVTGQLRRAQMGFNVTGFDLRIRLELDTDQVFHVYELHPVLVKRGEYDVS